MVADEILAKKARDGDTGAYGELVRRYQDRVYGMALRMLATPEDARDACQDVFVKAFRSLADFNYRSGFATWLYRIASNTCLDMLRRRGREGHLSVSGSHDTGFESVRDDAPGPEETLLQRERLTDLRRAVKELPDEYRLALVLHHYQGLSYRQVSEVTGLSEKTVATRIHRAKKILREKLLGGESDALRYGKKENNCVPGRRMPVI